VAQWYVSSVKWAALPQWAASHAYTVGQIIRSLATPAVDNECAYECTVAGTSGTSEPAYSTANNGTVTDGGVTWKNVTGQSSFAWTAPAGSVGTMNASQTIPGRTTNGDQVFIDSAHNETGASAYTFNPYFYRNSPVNFYSVNAAGAVPPGQADYSPGAQITGSGNMYINGAVNLFGLYLSAYYFPLSTNQYGAITLKDCKVTFSNITAFNWTGSDTSKLRCINTSFSCTNATFAGPFYLNGPMDIEWIDTPNPFFGSEMPNYIFASEGGWFTVLKLKGVNLSAFTGTVVNTNYQNMYILLDSCSLNSAVTIADGLPTNQSNLGAKIDLINCDSANTNYNNRRVSAFGTITTDTSTLLSSGATDGVTPFSHKMAASAYNSLLDGQDALEGFPLVAMNSTTGTALVATVQIITSSTLGAEDIYLDVDYLGSGTSCISSKVSTRSVLDSATLSAGTGTWSNPPGSPKQYALSVSFTPQKAGPIRGIVKLTKPSVTAWYDPELTIT
jgi:hypothetical protein